MHIFTHNFHRKLRICSLFVVMQVMNHDHLRFKVTGLSEEGELQVANETSCYKVAIQVSVYMKHVCV
jgi:hypothetical protein